MPRRSSAFGELLSLLFLPVVWLLHHFVGRKRAPPDQVMRFYQTVQWKRLAAGEEPPAQHTICCNSNPKLPVQGELGRVRCRETRAIRVTELRVPQTLP